MHECVLDWIPAKLNLGSSETEGSKRPLLKKTLGQKHRLPYTRKIS